MKIAGMVKSSLVDFPGLVAGVLFVPGCNYDCFYCHNRSLLENDPELMDPELVEAYLKKRSGLLDGIVITGGEPTLQPDLIPFIRSIKALGYRVKLDTNGANPQVIEDVLESGLCDYFAVDYKAPASRYAEICGRHASSQRVLETIETLRRHQACFEVRTTVIPQLSQSDLLTMAKELPPLPRYVLNPYRPPERYRGGDRSMIKVKPYTPTEIQCFALQMQKDQPHIEG